MPTAVPYRFKAVQEILLLSRIEAGPFWRVVDITMRFAPVVFIALVVTLPPVVEAADV